jgi:hypothetical protein
MRLYWILVGACALLLTVVAPASAATCTDGWRAVKVRDLDGRWRALGASSVTVVPGTHEAWATGGPTGILRFNGRYWAPVTTPQPPDTELSLRAIYARAPSDVWAVGSYRYREGPDIGRQPLNEHWDGTVWLIVASPRLPIVDPDGDGGLLRDVIAVAPDNAWAVGRHDYDGNHTALVQHWDGSEWTTVPDAGLDPESAPAAMQGEFWAVTRAPCSSTLWFLGGWADELGAAGPLLQRHKDRGWKAPLALGAAGTPVAATARSWDDIWAVGHNHGGPDRSALTLHKDRAGWSVVPSPVPPVGTAALQSVAAVSSTNVWAVGRSRSIENNANVYRPLIEHWDGLSWSIARSPLDGSQGILSDIALRRSGWGWAVGEAGPGNADGAILQACGI